jgi:integrase
MASMSRDHVVYFVKRPGNGRASFAVVKRTVKPDGKREHSNVVDERIVAVNRSGLNAADKCLQIEALCAELNAAQTKLERGVYVASEANLQMLNEYWDKEYQHRKLEDPKAARNRLVRAVNALGMHALLGDRGKLQKYLDGSLGKEPRKHRAVVAGINQMRQHFGVGESLYPMPLEAPEFKYLTEVDVLAVAKYLSDWHVTLLKVLFGTGLRIGEAFAIRPEHHRDRALNVVKQRDRLEALRPTKTRKQRKTYVLEMARPLIKPWAALELSRNSGEDEFREALQRACRKAFPGDSSKWLTIHELRHSYAVHMLTAKNASISIIAKLLGNSVVVCEKYYLNFTFEDDALAALD